MSDQYREYGAGSGSHDGSARSVCLIRDSVEEVKGPAKAGHFTSGRFRPEADIAQRLTKPRREVASA